MMPTQVGSMSLAPPSMGMNYGASSSSASRNKNYILAFREANWVEQTSDNLRLMFDTGAALHVCPPWFGDYFPTFSDIDQRIVGPDGTGIKNYGLRTVYFKMLPDMPGSVGVTFTVCDVQEPILSFSQMRDRGYAAIFKVTMCTFR